MLLLFICLIISLALSDHLFDLIQAVYPASGKLLWRFGVNIERYSVLAGLAALGFFIYSIYRKNPQIQFVLEIIICCAVILIF